MARKVAIVADIGGTNIKIGLMEQDQLIATTSIPSESDKGLKGRLPLMVERVNEMMLQYNVSAGEITGFGMSSPGIVDSVEKRILSIDKKFSDAPDLNLAEWAQNNWHTHFEIENDARAALIGEWKFGSAKGNDNVVMMTIGTGIGSSAIIEGRLLKGKHFLAGILGGHFTINYRGEKCNCGNIGCAEAETATWNLRKLAHTSPLFWTSRLKEEAIIDYESVFRLAACGDSLAKELKLRSLKVWSAAAINLIHAYDPEVLVIGGGVMASKDEILPFISEEIQQCAWTPWGTVEVLPATFINESALLGVGSLLLNHKN